MEIFSTAGHKRLRVQYVWVQKLNVEVLHQHTIFVGAFEFWTLQWSPALAWKKEPTAWDFPGGPHPRDNASTWDA